MDVEQLLGDARALIAGVTYCFAVTASESGAPHARIVQPRKPGEDWAVGFLTWRHSRKAGEIEANGCLTLAYQNDAEQAHVCLMGPARMIDDRELKRAIWNPGYQHWFPGGPEDPDVVDVRLATTRIELWSAARGIMPEPAGSRSAVLLREDAGWRYSTT